MVLIGIQLLITLMIGLALILLGFYPSPTSPWIQWLLWGATISLVSMPLSKVIRKWTKKKV